MYSITLLCPRRATLSCASNHTYTIMRRSRKVKVSGVCTVCYLPTSHRYVFYYTFVILSMLYDDI